MYVFEWFVCGKGILVSKGICANGLKISQYKIICSLIKFFLLNRI